MTVKRCKFCKEEGRHYIGGHYIGGSPWVCFKHYLVLMVDA